MLWTIFAVLVGLWLLGAAGGIAGNLIHLLLVLAGIVLLVTILANRRTAL